MDFDEDRIYYSHQNLQSTNNDATNNNNNNDTTNEEERPIDTSALRRHYREFLRNYRQSNRYIYRDRLLRMHRRHHAVDDANANTAAGNSGSSGDWNPNKSCIHVDLAHVGEYDAALLGQLLKRPGEALPVFEVAAADALRTLSYRTSDAASTSNNDEWNEEGEENQQQPSSQNEKLFTGNSIQILLRGNITPTPLRSIQSRHMNTLLKCPGIVVSAARSRPRAMCLRVRCGKCMDVRTVFGNSSVSGTGGENGGQQQQQQLQQLGSSSPFSGFSLPNRCLGPNPQGEKEIGTC
jgi:DNA replicative helicase MCM subunit Mcm2 (Cdc46/Mcm family)